jgi:hypothetical protein
MPTKITAIYDNPTDPEAFESGYVGQVDLARAVPGVLHVEASKVWPKEDGTPTPAHRLLDLYFADYDAASTAVTTPSSGRSRAASSRSPPAACGSCSPTWRSRRSPPPEEWCWHPCAGVRRSEGLNLSG